MVNFLMMLVFAPLVLGLTWIYISPMPRLDGNTPVKVIIRIVLFVAIFGGFLAQLGFLAHHEPPNARRFYVMTLLVIEAIPGSFILISRDPGRFRPKHANGTDGAGTNDRPVSEEKLNLPADRSDKVNMVQDVRGSLQVVIPPRRNWHSFMYAVLVVACGIAGILALQLRLTQAVQGKQRLPGMTGFIHVIQAIDMLIVAYLLAAVFTGTRTLTLTSAILQIRYILLGVPIRTQSFDNSRISTIRYESSQIQSRNGTVERRGIRFEVGSKTYSFGNSITEPEAYKLIERMRQLYPFPVK